MDLFAIYLDPRQAKYSTLFRFQILVNLNKCISILVIYFLSPGKTNIVCIVSVDVAFLHYWKLDASVVQLTELRNVRIRSGLLITELI